MSRSRSRGKGGRDGYAVRLNDARRVTVLSLALLLAACGGPSSGDLTAIRQQVAEGKVESALPALKALLADQPNSAEARYLLGLALLQQRDPKAAELELRKARELGYADALVVPPLAEALLNLGKAERLLSDFGAMRLQDPAAQAALLVQVAEAQLQKGRRDLAATAVSAALAAAPDNVRAKILHARMASIDGHSDTALAELNAVNEQAGRRNADIWQARGDVLLYGKNDLDGALEAYAQAIAVRPDQVLAHFSRIQILLFKNDAEGARQALQALQKVAPGLLQTRFAEAQLAYVSKDFGKAKNLVQGLLALVPDDVRMLTLSGAISLRTREFQLGETNLARALQLAPTLAMPRKLLAQIHLLMGKPTTALSDLQPLLEAANADTTAMTLAAEAQLALGDFRRADELYQRALTVSPTDAGIRLSAALSRLARGDGAGLADLEALAATESGDTAALAVISTRLRRGETDQALKQIQALVKRAPNVAGYRDLEGSVLFARGDRVGATAALNQARELDAAFFPAVKKLSAIELAAGNPAAAQRLLEDFVKKYPRHSEARMAWVEWLIFQKRPREEVARSLEELIQFDAGYLPARLKLVDLHLAARASKQAVGAAQDAVTAMPDRPELLEALGRAQVAASELQQALNSYQKLAGLLPKSPLPLMRIADIQVQQNNPAGAESSLRRALDLAPDNAEVRRRLMALALAAKKPEAAIKHAREMQRSRPKSAVGYMFEAEVAAGLGDWVGAAKALQTGVAAQAEPAGRLSARLWVALKQSKQDAAADAVMARFAKDKPDRAVDFFVHVADLLMSRGDWAQAEGMYREAIQRQPNNVSALNNVAWLMVKQGKPGASSLSARAVALAKGKAPILDTHALALAADEQVAAGVAAAEEAVKREPGEPRYRLTLARLLIKAKQSQRARDELERLKALGGGYEGAQDVPVLLQSLGAK